MPKLSPVGCMIEVHRKTVYGGTATIEPTIYKFLPVGTLLYTSPPKKEWSGLTDEEIWHLSQYNCGTRGEFAKAIEAKLKEKNNG